MRAKTRMTKVVRTTKGTYKLICITVGILVFLNVIYDGNSLSGALVKRDDGVLEISLELMDEVEDAVVFDDRLVEYVKKNNETEITKLSTKSCSETFEPYIRFLQQHDYKLFIIIESGYMLRRHLQRTTWISRIEEINSSREKGNGMIIGYVFVCMQPEKEKELSQLRLEAAAYDDIIIFDIPDKYTNLVTLTISALEWVKRNIEHEFLLKTDDDIMLDVGRVLNLLGNKSRNDFFGLKGSNPFHNHFSLSDKRWTGASAAIRRKEKVYDYYEGAGYILGSAVVRRILHQSNYLPDRSSSTKLVAEDVYIGYLLHHSINENPPSSQWPETVGPTNNSNITQILHFPQLYLNMQAFCKASEKEKANSWVIIHHLTALQMSDLWELREDIERLNGWDCKPLHEITSYSIQDSKLGYTCGS